MLSSARYRQLDYAIDTVQTSEKNGHTYVSVAQDLAAYPERLNDRLVHWAAVAPERTFMAKRDTSGQWRHISYAQALDKARHIGQALLDRGLSAERPVVILSGNDLEHAMLALACQHVGVAYAPISPAYSLVSQDFEKLRQIVKLLTPGLVFAAHGEQFANAMRAVCDASVEFVVTEAPPADRAATLFSALEQTPATAAVDVAYQATGPETIAKFLFTSGSTQQPKGVINTQRMLCSNMQMLAQSWPFLAQEPPVLLDWLPWNHTFGGNKNVNLVLYNGGTLYIDDGKPTPQLIGITLANLREIAPTIYFNVPKGWEEVARALESDAALSQHFHSRLQLQFYGGASLSQPIWDKLHASAEATVGERIVMGTGLGMTETAPCAMFVLRANVRAGDLGTPCPGMEIKLVTNGDKQEVRYRGPNVTPGYWRAPEQTRDAFDDEGFFCSGDAVKWRDATDPDLGFVFDGRVAEDFKLNTGTWVSVGPLRARVLHEGAPYVFDVVITGHDQGDVGLLILPNVIVCRQLSGCAPQASLADVYAAAPVREFFQQLVDRLYRLGTGSATRVVRAMVLQEPPSIDRGEITDKGSINQRAVLTHRAAQVAALYVGTDAAIIHACK